MTGRLRIFLLSLGLLAGPFSSTGASGLEAPTLSPSWTTVPIPTIGLIEEPPHRLAVHPVADAKLDGALADLAAGSREGRASGAGWPQLEDGRVQVQLVIAEGSEDTVRQAVAELDGELTGELENLRQIWIPPDRLDELASNPEVLYLRLPEEIVLAGDDAIIAMSEGVAAANAAAWQAAGWRGQGVRIAVIDGGFQGYSARLGSELPANVTVKNFVDGQPDAEVDATTRHGTACAEIIHDMAPLAELYLLKIATDIDLNEAVDFAISHGVDVISTSLTFVNVTPGDGTGRFATMVQKARAAGILWVTAAGNYRESHWSGAFTDSDGDNLHEFGPGVEVNVFGPGNNTAFLIPAGVTLSPSIRWNDWTAVNQDFRLLLLRFNETTDRFEIVAGNNNPQTGQPGQRPTERIIYVTSGQPAIYGVAIQRVNAGRAVHFNLLVPNRKLDRRVPPMSLGNLADVPAALTIAAVNVASPFPQEAYSSEGPTNGPGGGPAGGVRKPDLAAFANVSTASFGVRAFDGTSAATPHVAGAAALVLSAYPAALPGDVQGYLQSRAVNQGPPGPDTQFGYGRLSLGSPPGPWTAPYRAFVPVALDGR